MSKMPEPYTLTEQLHRAAQRSAYYGDVRADLLASAAEALEDHDRDVAHAVALERERIAKWHEGVAKDALRFAYEAPVGSNRRALLMEGMSVHTVSAGRIRNGAHNEQEVDE